ncbi:MULTISPECIES: YgfZ/GcvT domain-containing protein [Mesorhizobium]|uniref:Folate-binding protein n=1 Tax=Mesorhizobium denitrificans TaxID=2294114 RepID=A0A371XIU4_9HYPH|nr:MULTISPECIES: folate-binding protein YgfZ [Mesorhizobium]RFC69129.1 folate-binding protein [Mesorhizobium denitrificans]
MPVVILEDRALIEVSGPDAEHFLQNVLTTDLDSLPAGVARPGALLTPQGKILFDYLVFRRGNDGLVLDCRADIAADFAKRLTFYRLRAKAVIEVKNQDVAVIWGENESGSSDSDSSTSQIDSTWVRDARFKATKVERAYGASVAATGTLQDWTRLRIENGIVESGTDYELSDAFPHDVLFDQIDGVGFRKGCYIGQEVVSRMQHRGTARRRVLIAAGESALTPGAEITASGKPVGKLGSVAGARGLAIARIDRVKAAMDEGTPLLADGVTVRLAIPEWAGFTFPHDAAEEG